MYKIAIIEDDKAIREELNIILSNNGYEVCEITQFREVAKQVKEIKPHMLLLDINLPNEDGYKICMNVRKFSELPIIFVTCRDTDMDEVKSLMMGGDDFVTKPYNISVLLSRISILLKRVYKDINQFILKHNGITLNIETGKIEMKGESVDLTKSELKILIYLFRNVGKIVSRAELTDYLWDNDLFVDDNTLSVNITRIRGKLESMGVKNLIETKHRQGYYIK